MIKFVYTCQDKCMKEYICQCCGHSFKTYNKNSKFCSQECYKSSIKIKKIGSKLCKNCSLDMKPRTKNDYKKTFCNQKCRTEYEQSNPTKLAKNTKLKISESLKNNTNALGHIGSTYWKGKKKSKESIELMRGKLIGKPSGKKGIKLSQDTKDRISRSLTGKKDTPEAIKNKRKAYIKITAERLEAGQQLMPNWNPEACDYFEEFDKDNNTSGQHARNGGEYYIEELGYWVDYINHDLKLIMEYDEVYHQSPKQKEKDIIRQEEIQEYFSDYKFRRIKQCSV